jgi:MFS family permease
METRALAIAFFYAVGTAIGGITGPLLFGKLVETGSEDNVFWGYMLGAVLMILAGIVQAVLGIEAARRNLEDVATPLSAEEADESSRREREPRRPYSYSPVMQSSSRVPDADIDEEVAALAAALREAGELSRDELGRRVECRLWGPGRYRRALAAAMQRGEIRAAGRGRFAAAGS